MDIIKENKYVTVKYLTDTLHYSTATINRDLNTLKAQKLIKRSYGGAELLKTHDVPLMFRYHKMKSEKMKIAKAAASYIKDGDTIFIDGSTTCQYIAPHLLSKKDVTVITNNIYLVSFLSENGVRVICLGGEALEPPNMLSGIETDENASHYIADKAFFSDDGFTDDGNIVTVSMYYTLHKTMRRNSEKTFFLADHEKLNIKSPKILFSFDSVDYVISGYAFPENTIKQFSHTTFINVNESLK